MKCVKNRFAVLSATLMSNIALAQQPNILFILADDWSYPHAMGVKDEAVKTPVFDRICREGVMFRNAHVSAPSCAPSRAAVLTGQYHWRLKEGANLCAFIPPEIPIYTDLLEDAGYYVGCAGKGYDPGDYRGRDREPAGNYFDNAHDFLSKRPEGKPFCFWLGSRYPHRPYNINQRNIDPSKVKVPPFLPDVADVRRDIAAYYNEVQLFDEEAGDAVQALKEFGELENTLIVVTSDNGWPFPRAKATCYMEGTRVPMAVRWGDMIKAGRIADDFVSLADLAPTFLELAGVAIPEQMTGRSLLDIVRSEKEGRVDPARDHILTGMERHTWRRSEGKEHMLGYPIRTIVTERYHYIRNFFPTRWPAGDPEDPKRNPPTWNQWKNITFIGYCDIDSSITKGYMAMHREEEKVKPLFDLGFGKRPACELYDLQADPYEMVNLADDPDYADVVKDLDARLMSELEKTGDPRVVGGAEVFESREIVRDTDARQIKKYKGAN